MKTRDQHLSWMTQSIESFKSHLSMTKNKLTMEAYSVDVLNFMDYLLEKNVKRLATIKPLHIEGYLGACRISGKSTASVNRYYMSIRSFFRYLRKSKMIDLDLTQDIDAPKIIQKVPRIPTPEEIARLIETPDTSFIDGLRDRAMLELMYSSGLRVSEVCDLKVSDIGDMCITVTGKRGKTRTVPINTNAHEWIVHYLDHRESPFNWLFVTRLGRKLTRQELFKMVDGYRKEAGLMEITPHTLRHACATHFLDNGADLRLIQEVLGHASIASTQRYTHLSGAQMRERFNLFNPRGLDG